MSGSNAGKGLASRAWRAFTERFLMQYNHWPYVDKLADRVTRPGENIELGRVARGYPELEFNTAMYKRGSLEIAPVANQAKVVPLVIDETDPLSIPGHIPRPSWQTNESDLALLSEMPYTKGYMSIGLPYRPVEGEWRQLGIHSDFEYIDTY